MKAEPDLPLFNQGRASTAAAPVERAVTDYMRRRKKTAGPLFTGKGGPSRFDPATDPELQADQERHG